MTQNYFSDENDVGKKSHSQFYRDALLVCHDRYCEMAQQDDDLLTFIEEFRQGIKVNMPFNKLNRWLGYIQGVLIERGRTTVTEERDFTRPFFRPLDYPE